MQKESTLKKIIICSFMLITLSLAGCGEPEAQISAPKSYNKSGIIFSYPGNWTALSEHKEKKETKSEKIVVESPGNTIVIIIPAPSGQALSLKKFAEEFSQSANQETPITSVSASQFKEVEHQQDFQTITEKLTINLLGVKVPHTRIYHRKFIDNKAYFLIAQFSDEDQTKIIPGVNLIAESLKKS